MSLRVEIVGSDLSDGRTGTCAHARRTETGVGIGHCAEVRVAILATDDPMRCDHPLDTATDRPSRPDTRVFNDIWTECAGLAACRRTTRRYSFEVLPRNAAGSVEEHCPEGANWHPNRP